MQNTAKQLAWFSRLLCHLARKRDGLILQRSWAHTGQHSYDKTSQLKVGPHNHRH